MRIPVGPFSLLLAFFASPVLAQDGVRLQTVAVTGEPAPGLPAGIDLEAFLDVDVGASGFVTFRAALAGTGVGMENDAANYLAGKDGVILLARDGDQAAGLEPGRLYKGLCYFCAIGPIPGPRLHRAGTGGFMTLIEEPGTIFGTSSGLFRFDSIEVRPFLVTGNPAPVGATFPLIAALAPPRFGPRGDLAVSVQLAQVSGLQHPAILAGASRNLRVVGEVGNPVPGVPAMVYSSLALLQDPDAAGRVTFFGGLADASMPTITLAWGLLAERGGAPVLRFQTGAQALGQPPGVVLHSFGPVVANARGDTAYLGFLNGTGIVLGQNSSALLSDRSGAWETVAQVGSALAVLPGESIQVFMRHFLGARGEVVFHTLLKVAIGAPRDEAILLDTGRRQRLLARTGQHAPGLPSTILLDTFVLVDVNAAGQALFSAWLTGPGVVPANAQTLYLTDRAGRPRLLARSGDAYEVRPGDVRTIASVAVPFANTSSPGSPLNNRGVAAFGLSFTDSTQALVRAKIPEVLEALEPARPGLPRNR